MTDPIQDFINRSKKMSKANREMRLTYEEVMSLALALADILYNKPKEAPKTPSIISGGTFPKS
jgi:hypothetical protein